MQRCQKRLLGVRYQGFETAWSGYPDAAQNALVGSEKTIYACRPAVQRDDSFRHRDDLGFL